MGRATLARHGLNQSPFRAIESSPTHESTPWLSSPSNQNGGAVIGRRLITTTPRTVGLNLSYSF